ncbi:toll/interleukin-1 receptor domain-containing protein, partial [Bradyrhizobium sp.]|uniref:toll/interleukin-1 receptor domain-containing protein n=1 Tax=Bradyrhizobium sp. TaxID=376 RepID=UPI003C239A00
MLQFAANVIVAFLIQFNLIAEIGIAFAVRTTRTFREPDFFEPGFSAGNKMPEPEAITHAFVSYAHVDLIIADALETQLTYLAQKGKGKAFLKSFLDTKSIGQPGQPYGPIIRAALQDADWLIVIFTGHQSVYCGFEIGLFSSINPGQRPIICLHDVDQSKLPGVLDGYQTAPVGPDPTVVPNGSGQEMKRWWNSPVGQFLQSFCTTKNLYTPADNPIEYPVDIAMAAKAICDAFENARKNDVKSETPVQASFEITIDPSITPDFTRIPENSVLVGTSRAFNILGLNLPLSLSSNQAPQITWGDMRTALREPTRPNIPWMDKLEINIARAAALKLPEPEDVTFKGAGDGRIYRAILTRYKLFFNGKRIFYVLLVETFDRKFIGNRQSSLLLIALTLASRWRFTFFEKWPETLMKFDPSVSDEAFADACKQLEYNMEWMENEGVELGADDPNAMVEAFGLENKVRVERFYTSWDTAKRTLKSQLPATFDGLTPAARVQAQTAIVAFLTWLKQQNSEFLRLCADA